MPARTLRSLLIIVVIVTLAMIGLFLAMGGLSRTAPVTPVSVQSPLPTTSTQATPTPVASTNPVDDDSAVATVNGQAITETAWRTASRLDAVMSRLASQEPPQSEQTLQQLVNEIIILEKVTDIPVPPNAEVEQRLAGLLSTWQLSEDELLTMLQAEALQPADLNQRLQRLIQVEAALRALETTQGDISAWLAEARREAQISLLTSLTLNPTPHLEITREFIRKTEPTPSMLDTATPPPATPNLTLTRGSNVDNLAPDFSLKTLNGETINQPELFGKPTLINFWASWCPPCRQELPALESTYQKYGDRINFLAIDVQENESTVSAFAKKLGLTFPIAFDETGKVSKLDYRVVGLPTTVFLDAQGVIVARHVGPLDESKIDSYLMPLLETLDNHSLDVSPTAVPFSLMSATGDTVSLADYQAEGTVVLVFYRGHT